ncbi:large conductance mechanosensitive channel protein MscL [Streptococcus constellatus subsp. pharyngis]|uniref:Large-conductance mechanosensitive channel n=1 Tax=Streptococcus constellatus subsp. pharyngis SK1060 = CCUG 46377 TaxID=1035184 RepID=F9P606_STRCV|nr:large conductance mechanosensitive channel protein MscL [Streptococcus constellatus]AGU72666.1 putative large conductance mechano-sensitive ion channel [Streptococcus constellatus subsp. pharyngis C232]AGU74422.1 putative large conductance mechano-sensitive ion channel [Streptococcus constellatus subsp. pharyngis C818]AGU79839.1 putative large conductance mechano-sensitive ion channel [Streptococcus constellatus subsp. pharyngis C1050]EGV09521.1 large conductance mechanosensitive channel pro
MLKELKNFLLRGNVIDLAVGVVIANAFGAIVKSLIEDVITPLFLNPAIKAAGVEQIAGLKWNGIAYGSFLSAIINFLVIGTVLFFIVKSVEKAQNLTKKEDTVEESAGPTELEVLQEIKVLLEKK